MPKESPKKGSGYSSTSSEELPKPHYFISKKFTAPDVCDFPTPSFQDIKLR